MLLRKILLFLAVLTIGSVAFAAPVVTNLLNLQVVSNATANTAATATGAFVPAQVYFVQNTGLTSTNAAIYYAQISLDNTNFTTYATNQHAATNAVVDTFTCDPNPVTLYFRVQVVTTNAVTNAVQQLR